MGNLQWPDWKLEPADPEAAGMETMLVQGDHSWKVEQSWGMGCQLAGYQGGDATHLGEQVCSEGFDQKLVLHS